jgi:hypothetical protein
MSFERIVRPFQSPTPFRGRLLPPNPEAETEAPENVVVTITGKASSEYVEGPPPWALGFQIEWVEDRDRRITELVRVENPNDPSQFVEIERIKQMILKNTVTGEELPIKPQFSNT